MFTRGGLCGAQALLEMEDVPAAEFEADVLACLPQAPWSISRDEVARRRDLRSARHGLLACYETFHSTYSMT